ncbi:MAG: hypothetical protein RR847_02570 [Bacilli bacterium]
MEKEHIPSLKEKIVVSLILLCTTILIVVGSCLTINHFINKKEVIKPIKEETTTIDLTKAEGKELVQRIENKYGQKIYFLQKSKIVDFNTLTKVEKICFGLGSSDTTVTTSNEQYKAYSEKQILSNLKVLFNIDFKIDPLEPMGTTLIYDQICPSSVLIYSAENAAYYTKPLALTEPLPDVVTKITRIERKNKKLIVYGNAVFRDSKGNVYKDLKDKVEITDFKLSDDGKNFMPQSSEGNNFDYYLKNSYQYIFTITDDENLYWLSYERSEQ